MRSWICLAIVLLAPSAALAADASSYPNRPIPVIIPFPPGGNVDVFGRVLYRHVEDILGQTIVIGNRGGANGILGADIAKNPLPDG